MCWDGIISNGGQQSIALQLFLDPDPIIPHYWIRWLGLSEHTLLVNVVPFWNLPVCHTLTTYLFVFQIWMVSSSLISCFSACSSRKSKKYFTAGGTTWFESSTLWKKLSTNCWSVPWRRGQNNIHIYIKNSGLYCKCRIFKNIKFTRTRSKLIYSHLRRAVPYDQGITIAWSAAFFIYKWVVNALVNHMKWTTIRSLGKIILCSSWRDGEFSAVALGTQMAIFLNMWTSNGGNWLQCLTHLPSRLLYTFW